MIGAQPHMTIEASQDALLQAMVDLGMTRAELESNLRRHGRLFLAPAVLIALINGDVGRKKIDALTGDFDFLAWPSGAST
jgi:adenylosuccinate lyase